MKFTKFPVFEKHVKGATPQKLFVPVYMLLGKDPFSRRQAIDCLVQACLQNHPSPNHCIKSIESDQLSLEMLIHELEGFSLFAEKQILILHNAEKLPRPLHKPLERYLLNPNQSLYLIISGTTLSSSLELYKRVEKAGIILEFEEEKEWVKEKNQVEWAAGEISRLGKQIHQSAAQYLVRQIGIDSAMLHNEIQKLICYIGERREITAHDIDAICSQAPLTTIWQLGEAIFYQDVSRALRISKLMLEAGTPFFSMLRQIRHQFETEFHVSSILASGGTASEISQLFPYMKGAILDKHIRMAQDYGIHKLRKGILKIDEIELMAKNSSTDVELLNELLTISLTT